MTAKWFLFTIGMIILSAVMGYFQGASLGEKRGIRKFKNSLPSCLYIRRPMSADKPVGCDGKEGIDMINEAHKLNGGGYFVSLHKWKCE